ncbi:MAG TPA: ribonuclease E/G, partial [Gaiellaceae bacterium]|nr:ribonuclease E/G [Gaiellaceae bacterium]
RDIGGIIVIDFIDMANPKNRATVEEALKTELERDRTKTYVVEISPLGLVEMTRQNVTEGPREILASKCPTCAGDGIVLSTHSAAIDMERKLRDLARNAKRGVEAFRVELEEHVAAHLIGPGATRLTEIETLAKRRFFLEGTAGAPLDHFKVKTQGKLADIAPDGPVEEGSEVRLELVEVGEHDLQAGVGKLDGLAVNVAGASNMIGKKVKVRVERVLNGTAYATLVQPQAKVVEGPITAESEAEKPTRAPRKKTPETPKAEAEQRKPEAEKPKAEAEKPARAPRKKPVREPKAEAEKVEAVADEVVVADEEPPKPRKKTRRGSRGGRGRKKKPASAAAAENGQAEEPVAATATIHVPSPDLGKDGEAEASTDGEQPAAVPKKKRTRRGSRGGRNRRKKSTTAAGTDAGAASSQST